MLVGLKPLQICTVRQATILKKVPSDLLISHLIHSTVTVFTRMASFQNVSSYFHSHDTAMHVRAQVTFSHNNYSAKGDVALKF